MAEKTAKNLRGLFFLPHPVVCGLVKLVKVQNIFKYSF